MDGLTIARERIVREAEEKTGFLDLGRLGLTELPEELFQLKHLRGLNLGAGGASELEDNFVEGSLHRLAELGELRRLSLSGTDLSDFAPLQGLTNLQSLDCSLTQVTDLEPLRDLVRLQSLDCTSTQVSDLGPLRGLINRVLAYSRLNNTQAPFAGTQSISGHC